MIVEAAGFGTTTPEEPAEVGPDSVLRLSVELEFTGLFTEVGESTLIGLGQGIFHDNF